MKKLTVSLLFLLAAGIMSLRAQQITISGTITNSEDGSGVPGASIIVKGTTIGTITSADGKYSLKVPEDAQALIVSFIGMKTTEVAIAGKTTINIVLEPDVLGLDEVVVTAIGISKEKKALGYSVEDVGSEEIVRSGNTNVINSLSGKVAGVKINSSAGTAGAASYIEIRGAASISNDNRPLFVIDGIPIDGTGGDFQDLVYQSYEYGTGTFGGVAVNDRIGDINPDDIESITVLKGGAATALYGIQAGNGAIVITTKKGEKAAPGKVVNVSIHSNISISQISQMPELQTTYAQGVSQDICDEMAGWFGETDIITPIGEPDGGYYGFEKQVSFGPNISELSYTTDPNYVPGDIYWNGGTTSMEEYIRDWNPNGRIVFANDPLANGKSVKTYNPYDYFQKGISKKNSIAVSGGSNNTTYYFSYSNADEEGVVPNNTFNKNTAKLSGKTVIAEKWTASSDMTYLNTNANYIQQGSNISGVMLGLLRTAPTFDNSNGYQLDDFSQRNYRGGGGYDNPYWTSNNISFGELVNRFMGNTNINYQPVEWLRLTYRIGTDWYLRTYKDYFEIGSNNFPNGLLRKYHLNQQNISSDLMANINKDINDDINLNLLVGNNMYQRQLSITRADANGLSMYNWNNLANTSDLFATEVNEKYRTAAYYGDLGISYKDLVFINVTGRGEWATTLSKDENFFFFPSFNGSFILTELSPLKDNPVLSFAKLRGSYAIVANIPDAYSTKVSWLVATPGDGWTQGLQYPLLDYPGFTYGNTIPDAKISPELTNTIEFGTDIRLYNNRLGFDVSYFKNVSDGGNLISAPISASSGHDKIYGNLASIETKGLEILATVIPVKQKDGLTWEITGTFSNPKTTVTKLAEGVDNVELNVGFVDPQVRAMVDERYRTLYGTRWLRDEQGNVIINAVPNPGLYRTEGLGYPIQDAESGILGVVEPDWTLGINNSLSFKGITLSALLEIKRGGQMWNGTKGALYYFGTHADTEDRETATDVVEGVYGRFDAETSEIVYTDADGNDLADGAAPIKNTKEIKLDENWYFWEGPGSGFTGPCEPFIEDTDWTRLRELQLSYRIPQKILANTFIKGLEIYYLGTNLYLKTPYTGIDPETSLFGNSNAQGIDYFNMPGTKSHSFGLRLDL